MNKPADIFDLADLQESFHAQMSWFCGQVIALTAVAQVNRLDIPPAVEALRKACKSFQQWHLNGTPVPQDEGTQSFI